jgi:ribonuclease HI
MSLFDDESSAPIRDAIATGAETVIVYTDGACSGNPGPGGWAWAVAPDGHPRGCGAEGRTTNQRMEVLATLRAVEHFADDPRTLRIVSDSTYVVKCFNEKWWEGWMRRGWRNSQRQPVANRDLWEPLIDAVRRRGNVEFEWVKGHSGDPMNDLVDALAVSESRRAGGDG